MFSTEQGRVTLVLRVLLRVWLVVRILVSPSSPCSLPPPGDTGDIVIVIVLYQVQVAVY